MANKLCFVDGCQTRSDQENGPATFFRPPKVDFDEWKKIFPEKTLLQTSRLCWKHFAGENIIKGKMIGEEFVHQKRWRLKKGAKPKHLLGTVPVHLYDRLLIRPTRLYDHPSACTTFWREQPLFKLLCR
ncbi:Uncharacterized protein APZ42_031316 [Daphnia magna]|uniref:THAP-type domain-containing protein n=1 Tax=Daphnia magna TaxID=35525 RepID=A0A164MY35_9CRUS|nr:Uncharacterized protein APZ42_031316 [Daphnia magna]